MALCRNRIIYEIFHKTFFYCHPSSGGGGGLKIKCFVIA